MADEPDRLRRPAQLRLSQLLRPGDAWAEQGGRGASGGLKVEPQLPDAGLQPGISTASAFASATYESASHTVILKLVNVNKDPLDVAINLRGTGKVDSNATASVLAGNPKDQNTIDEPTKVSPKRETVTDVSASFHRTFPPYSFTLIRLITSPQ